MSSRPSKKAGAKKAPAKAKQPKAPKVPEAEEGRAYDDRGNVRPADVRYLEGGEA